MAVTPWGVDDLTSVSDRIITPEVVDQIYVNAALYWRANRSNRRMQSGGLHIEVPLQYAMNSFGGFYSGADIIPIGQTEQIKNAAFGWKQAAIPVMFTETDMLKIDSPKALLNMMEFKRNDGVKTMGNLLAGALYKGVLTNAKSIDSIDTAIDDGTVSAAYGGITRASNTWWRATRDASTATLGLEELNALHSACCVGGTSPSIIISRKEQYNRYWNLPLATQEYVHRQEPMARDQLLLDAGFNNLLFNNVPWIIDDKCHDGPNASNSAILMLNEDFMTLYVHERGELTWGKWRQPINQELMASTLTWAGNLVFSSLRTQGIMTAVTG